MFHQQSEKYSIKTDEFEGEVRTRDGYYEEKDVYLNVAFGYRASADGEWAVAVYAPDLANASPAEERKWIGFEILGEEGFIADDSRFQKWWARYILGDWDIEDGPIARDFGISQSELERGCLPGRKSQRHSLHRRA
jgi:hypothetical protein